MTAFLVGLVALIAVVIWVVRPRRRPPPAPEDDVSTPIDEIALAEAEQELREDPHPRESVDGFDDNDDWGPGAPP